MGSFFAWYIRWLLSVGRLNPTSERAGKEALTKSADPGDDILLLPVLRDRK